jgi:hypothetical protein
MSIQIRVDPLCGGIWWLVDIFSPDESKKCAIRSPSLDAKFQWITIPRMEVCFGLGRSSTLGGDTSLQRVHPAPPSICGSVRSQRNVSLKEDISAGAVRLIVHDVTVLKVCTISTAIIGPNGPPWPLEGCVHDRFGNLGGGQCAPSSAFCFHALTAVQLV